MSLQDPRVTLENCRFCLMCTHVAPIGNLTMLESYTPHGMALLATSQERDLIGWDQDTIRIMFSEVDGGNSRAHCVFSQPFEESIAAVRAQLAAGGLAPESARTVYDRLAAYGNPYREQKPTAASGQGEIALFAGDAAPYLWPSAMAAALSLLEKAGIKPAIVGHGRNSGLLAHSLGFPTLARELAQKTIAEIEEGGVKTLIVFSAGDYYAFTTALEERLDLALPEDVEVIELSQFLLDGGHVHAGGQDTGVVTAYVDPTHAVRVPDRHDVPRKLAAAFADRTLVELFWRRDRAQPVGSTYLQFTNPSLAAGLTRARLEDAQRAGAARLVCEDPATLYQLNRYAPEYGIAISGLFELLDGEP